MAFHIRSRYRGVNFIAGGLLVAGGFVLYLAVSGSLPVRFGAPQVRIDDDALSGGQAVGAAAASGLPQD